MACDARDGSLRYRQKGTNGVHPPEWNGILHDGSNNGISLPNGQRMLPSRHRRRLLGERFYACLLAFYLGLALLVFRLQSALPDAVTSDSGAEGHVFVGRRARQLLKELVWFGQRTVGSVENEVSAVDFVVNELQRIKIQARPVHKLEFDVQQPNGSFFLEFIDGFTSSYRGVKNVVARLAPSNEPPPADEKHSLLVNCHYDSAPGSPGASDDAVNCAIMLEVLRVLSQRKQSLRHPVIFLFNGAEENILQGSHGFITQHKWAKEVAAFVNLEACGAGGKELLFQASPSDPWLVRAYVEGAARPFGSIIAEEVFQSGLIPSDTDFRIFRDFKGIPGLDFAFTKNGYVYHTKYDNMDYIPDGSIQHAGDNVLGLILKILEAPEMKDGSTLGPKARLDKLHSDRSVYYDFLGLFMVNYSTSMSSLMVKLIVIMSVISMALRMKSAATTGREMRHLELALQLWARIRALLVTVCSWGLGLLACLCVALVLTMCGSTMSWFNRPYLAVGLYYSTMVAALMAVHWTITVRRRRHRTDVTTGLKVLGDDNECDDWDVLERYLDATQLLWLMLVCFMALKNVLSYYIPWLWALSAGSVLSVGTHWTLGMGRRGEKRGLLAAYLGGLLLPLLLTLYLCFNIHMAIVPITGRNGTSDNPEILVALMSGFLAAACTSFVVPLMHVSRNGMKPIAVLCAITVVSIVIAVSPLGFPFSAAKYSAAPQRMLLFNVERNFYDRDQKLLKTDTGVWTVPLDYNGERTIREYIEPNHRMVRVSCDKHVYCGMPYYFPVITKLQESYYVDLAGPVFAKNRTFQLISQNRTISRRMLFFRFTGPSHMGLIISPRKGVTLLSWSFTQHTPPKGVPWGKRTTYFVYLSQGVDMGNWEFWLEFLVPENYPDENPVVDIAYHTYYLQKHEHRQKDFVRFLEELPQWVHATAWTASSDLYVF